MPPSFSASPPSINLLFGPILIGVCLNMMLYGILLMQMLTYYRSCKRDLLWIKCLVLYLFVVETCNTGFDIAIIYEPLVARYAQPEATIFFPTMFPTEPFCIVLISTPIQFFIAYRIWRVSRSKWVPLVICILSLGGLAGGLWTGVRVAVLRKFALKPLLHTPALLWFLSSCIADVIITISLAGTLYRRKTGFVVTDDRINHIIRVTVQTGMITSVAAIGDVVFFMVFPKAALNFAWDLALSKLYSNCLLSSLNGRSAWSSSGATHQVNNNPLFEDTSSHRVGMSLNGNRISASTLHRGDRSHTYPLTPTSRFDTQSADDKRGADMTVSITRVVETMEDPLPKSSRNTQSGVDFEANVSTQ